MEGVIATLGVLGLFLTFCYFVIRLEKPEKQEGGEADGDNKLTDGR